MALRGNLKDFTLPDVFQLITASKKTGVLRIAGRDDAEGSVWFRDGEVFFAQSNWHHEKLGDRLVAAQKITPSALARALQARAQEPSGRRIGRILVDEGYITESVLEAFVQEQIQDTVFDLMRWDDGDFDFEILPQVVEEDIGLTVSIENIIMEGSRRLEEWARIKKKVPSMDIVFRMATAPGEGTFEISLKPIEWNLLLLIDGTRSVSELARSTGRTDFEVARIVYGLFSAGLLEVTPEEESRRLLAEREERALKRAALAPPPVQPEEVSASGEEASPDETEGTELGSAVSEPIFEIASPAEPPAEPSVGEVTPPRMRGPVEVPEFLSTAPVMPSPDDMSVFEEMVGALLQHPAPIAPLEEEEEGPDAAAGSVTEVGAEAAPEVIPDVVPELSTPAEAELVAEGEPVTEPMAPGEPAIEPELEAVPPGLEGAGTEAPEATELPEVEGIEEAVFEGELVESVFVESGPVPDAYVEPAAEPRVPFDEAPEPLTSEIVEEEVQPAEEVFGWDLPAAEPMSLLEEPGTGEIVPEAPSEMAGEAELAWVEAETGEATVDDELEAELFAELGIGESGKGEPLIIEPAGELELSSTLEVMSSVGELDEVLETSEPEAEVKRKASTDASVDARFAGAISDEISALTGVQRQRPTAVVNSLEVGAAKLRRDVAVDRETLLKIIDGIQNL